MAEKVKNKKEQADIVLFELDPEYSKLKIGFGESFYHHDHTIWLSETPLQDPTLVPFDNVVVEDGVLAFDAVYKKKETHFSIHPVYDGTAEVAAFLKYLKEHTLVIDTKRTDNINILIEEDGATVRLVNSAGNRRAVITYSKKHGNTFLERFPDPSKRFQLQSCTIEGNTLNVHCVGPDLYDPASTASGYTYEWQLDIQEEFSPVITSLIQAAIANG